MHIPYIYNIKLSFLMKIIYALREDETTEFKTGIKTSGIKERGKTETEQFIFSLFFWIILKHRVHWCQVAHFNKQITLFSVLLTTTGPTGPRWSLASFYVKDAVRKTERTKMRYESGPLDDDSMFCLTRSQHFAVLYGHILERWQRQANEDTTIALCFGERITALMKWWNAVYVYRLNRSG